MRTRITDAVRPLTSSAPRVPRAATLSDYDLNSPPSHRPRPLTPAAVLVPIVEHRQGASVLLTRRTEHLHDHAGQVSFPGGRIEPRDQDPLEAALRETREEVGLSAEFINAVGYLDDYETVTGYLVTPVVAFVRPGFRLALDRFEVADAFEVPLDFLLDPGNHRIHSRPRNGVERRYYVFEYGERYIWGATAGILMDLYRRVAG